MTNRERRAVVLGAAVIVTAVALLRAGPWALRAHGALRDRAAESQLAVERAKSVIASAPQLRDSLTPALAAVVGLAPRLLDGGTPADAGAALAGQVSLIAAQAGVRVLRLDPLPDSAGLFGRVAVHTELEGDIRGLVRWLSAVERGEVLLSVPALALASNGAAPVVGAPEVLRIEATVTGLFLPRATR